MLTHSSIEKIMIRYIPRKYLLFILYLLFSYHGYVTSQGITDIYSNDTATPADKFEANLISSILRIIDDKFDSLSARLGTLERSVNGLQYYNLRQFRLVNTHLSSLDKIVHSTHSQMGQITIENKAMKNSLGLLKREIKSMEKLHNGMFEAFEQNFVYLNQDLSKKIGHIQQTIDAVNSPESGDEPEVRPMSQSTERSECNCTQTLSRIETKLDTLQITALDKLEAITVVKSKDDENKTAITTLYNTMNRVNDNLERSINLYRYTGDLVERIVGATETVSEDQTKIREDIRHFLETQTNNTCRNDHTSEIRHQNDIPNEINPNTNSIFEEERKCRVSLKVLQDALQLTKNNTQLLEITTDLAQLSQISMKSSIIQLQGEVMKLQNGRKNKQSQTSSQPEVGSISNGYDFESLLNTSKSMYHIVEAIASSTGWIPYVYHNLQYVEGRVNETLLTSRRILHKLLTSKTESDTPSSQTATYNSDVTVYQDENTFGNGSLSIGLNNKLEFLYNTNKKLGRLVPALTRLLGEPEPFITLVGGAKENEGRIEIYKKGKWGTICKTLGHIEAAYICRHLGYLGGISAGNGYYGPGSGIFWRINITCLYSRQCEIAQPVLDNTNCDHSQDAGIICDHMIRLTPGDDELTMRNIGRLDMYHHEDYVPMCSENWQVENTRVACRQLGYEDGEFTEVRESDLLGDGHIWMVNVTCIGNEMRLDECKHAGWILDGCKSRRPVFLHCH